MTEQEANKIFDEYLKEMNAILPEAKMKIQGWHSVNDNIGSLNFDFMTQQNSFDKTLFQTKVESQYIHYTSVDSLYSILNEEAIRCYPTKNMNDPMEVVSILQKLNLPVSLEMKEKIRRSLFVFSMCKYGSGNLDDFNMWRLYGKDGHGVGIVFEVENENRDWSSTIIGDVQYGNNSEIEKLFKETIDLSLKYGKFNLNKDEFPVLLNLLMALHKNSIWSFEKEARCVTYLDYDPMHGSLSTIYDYNINKENIGHYIDSDDLLSAYYKLDLSSKFSRQIEKLDDNDKIELSKIKLRLKVKKIVLGYKLNSTFAYSLRTFLTRYSQIKKLDYMIELQPSKLGEYFQ
jgi:hypothetical protein